MKRIVIDARESGTSTGRYVDKLVEYLHKLKPDYEITVLAKPHRINFLSKLAPDFKIQAAPYKEFTFTEQFGFAKQLRRLKADLVHFPMVQQPVLYRGKVITTMQDLTTARFNNPAKNPVVFKFKQVVYKWVIRRTAHKSTALIVSSKFVRDDVAAFAHVPARKFTVTYEAADKITEKPVAVEGLKDKKFVMYIGRPQPHKNLERLIEAFAKLRAERPGLNLVLAGQTDTNFINLEKLAVTKTDGVIFTGFVSEGQLRWLYEHAAVYVFPSLSEGFGLPGLEAMEHELPVVSSNATCLPEIYKDAVLYFDPLSVDDMADKIGQVLDDPELAKSLVKKGAKLVKTYSWQRMAEQTLAVYRQVLGE